MHVNKEGLSSSSVCWNPKDKLCVLWVGTEKKTSDYCSCLMRPAWPVESMGHCGAGDKDAQSPVVVTLSVPQDFSAV